MLTRILQIMFGRRRFCLKFHIPMWSDNLEWYGRWCRPCQVYHGGDRRKGDRVSA